MDTPTFFLPDQEVEWTMTGGVRTGRIVPRDSELLTDDDRERADEGRQLPVLFDGELVVWVFRSKLRHVQSPEASTYEYRAVVTCSQDPCSYCLGPARAMPQGTQIKPDYAEALVHGRGIARNVYGASTHHVTVERREVGPWRHTDGD